MVKVRATLEPVPNDKVPAELAGALKKNKGAAAAFAKLAPSHKREYVGYVAEARKPETRARRIQQTIETLAKKR